MIYLDNNATTRPLPSVLEAMTPYLSHCYFNPSASTAAFTHATWPRTGAAESLARLLSAEGSECFIFTSGATESNNWVFRSVLERYRSGSVLISEIEHPSVSESAEALTRAGMTVSKIPVNKNGVLDLDALGKAMAEDTRMVSVMAANNETGVLQPLEKISEIVRCNSPEAVIHTDATQAVGKIDINLSAEWQEIDLLSFSAHKFHGPKGIGGLYIRPGIELVPMLRGGGQENGLRSGTLNTPGLAGLSAAVSEINTLGLIQTVKLRDRFETELSRRFPDTKIHGISAPRLPNTSCFSFPGIVGDDLAAILASKNVIVGTGSACSSGALEPSKTLMAMGVDYDIAKAAIRISLGRFTSETDLTGFFEALCQALSVPQASG